MTAKKKRIFLSPPHLGGEEIKFVQEAFKSNYIAPLGPMVDAFEREFAEVVGIRHCAAVSSGTADMHFGFGEVKMLHFTTAKKKMRLKELAQIKNR
jgi:dTDP-4-amino-4,6-dideoxygalactose transaminase